MRRLIASLVIIIFWPALGMASVSESTCAAAARYSDAHRGVSVLVLDHGNVVCEKYHGSDGSTANELWSGTKSFVGIMAAAAVQDRMLTLDELAADTIIEWRSDPRKARTTIRQLLSMASGQPSSIGNPPSYADSLRIGLSADPGSRFQYGPAPMQIFGEVMRRKLIARGQDGNPLTYLTRRVLDPIGLKVAAWRKGPDGQPLMPQGAKLTARDWAKFGEFVRTGGSVDGKPLVDPATFAALFVSSPVNPSYGLTWWLPHAAAVADPVTASTDIGRRSAELPADLVVAAGLGDQRLYVIPSLGLTIVRQATLDVPGLLRGERSGWSDADFLNMLAIGK